MKKLDSVKCDNIKDFSPTHLRGTDGKYFVLNISKQCLPVFLAQKEER